MIELTADPRLMLLLAAASGAGAVVVLWRVARRSSSWSFADLFLTLGAFAFLWLLATKLVWEGGAPITELILLTEGATAEQVRLAQSEVASHSAVASLNSEAIGSPGPEALKLSGIGDLLERFPAVGRLHIVGSGLREDEWSRLSHLEVVPYLCRPVQGVVQVSFLPRVSSGEPVVIRGRIADQAGELKVQLHGPGGIADTAVATNGRFELQANAPVVGRHVFRVEGRLPDGDLQFKEPIAFEVVAPDPVAFLMLLGAPSFETRYLKAFLADGGNQVSVRTRVSKDRFRSEFINTPESSLDQLDAELLQAVDVVVLDGTELRSLPASDRQKLWKFVEADGLSVLVLPDGDMLTGPPSAIDGNLRFAFERYSDADEVTTHPTWGHTTTESVLPLAADPLEIVVAGDTFPVVQDREGRVVAAAYRLGTGLVGAAVLRPTYRWVLAGHARQHGEYWSEVISSLVRRPEEDRWTSMHPASAVVDEPVRLEVQTANTSPIARVIAPAGSTKPADQALADSPTTVYLKQDVLEPQRWSGQFWPRVAGWHQVHLQDGAPHWFYVNETDQWQACRQALRTRATQLAAVRRPTPPPAGASDSQGRKIVFPRWVLFLGFLVFCGCLWTRRR